MLVSFVLRLRPDHLAFGELVGEVEDVESGVRHPLMGTTDLIAFCARVAGSGGDEPGASRSSGTLTV
ncbi:MAG TPA: hypothetical protein VFW24_14195 [Acidimicrobiales bacterium]|nr:hypothetical protein [Acidimicrobiales bacterium]